MVRGKSEQWTALAWRETYRFKPEGYGWASRIDKYIVSQFQNPVNPKDKFAMEDCEDFWAKQVLEFLVPILYPEKPTRVTVTMGNTIFEALLGERPVDWGLLLFDVVGRMVGLIGKGKVTMVCPYMFHLYKGHKVLLSPKLAAYTLGIEMVKHNCIPDLESTPTASKSKTETRQPTLTLEGRKKRKTFANKQANSIPTVEI